MRSSSSFGYSFSMLACLGACSSSGQPIAAEPNIVAVALATPLASTPVDIPLPAAPSLLSTSGGSLLATLGTDVLRGDLTASGKLSQLPFVFPTGEDPVVGTPRWLAPRATGFLLLTDRGLYHDSGGAVVRSPLSAALQGKQIRAIDVTEKVGQPTTQTIWFFSGTAGYAYRASTLTKVELSVPTVDVLVGIDEERGLFIGGGLAYEVDLAKNAVREVASGIPPVHGFARDPDGRVYFATDTGLLVRGVDGSFTRHTMAAPGMRPRRVESVAAGVEGVVMISEGAVLLMPRDLLIGWSRETPSSAHPVSGADSAKHVALDDNGDVWVATASKLARFPTGKPVSFERDVKPFFAARCQTCHAQGTSGAPVRAFDSFEGALQYAPEILLRLRAEGKPVMPPGSALLPSDYRAIVRWLETGTPR